MSDFELQAGEVHLWVGQVNWPPEVFKQAYQQLFVAERQRVDRLRVEQAKQCAIVSAFSLRKILASYLQVDPKTLRIATGQQGKPYLPDFLSLKFNLSHSQDQLALAVTRHYELGVDVEFCRSRVNFLDLAERYFAPEEYQQLLTFSEEQQEQAFYRAWVRKEAFIKATGLGFAFGLDNFVVDLAPEPRNGLISVYGDVVKAANWCVQSLALKNRDCFAALAIQGPKAKCQYRQILPFRQLIG